MATYKTVNVQDLVKHCMRYYDEKWGYIYGAYGQIWTQAMQNAATDEQIKKYGQQWVGKHVIDCSGVWYLAMKELGSYMYHGSNTMWKSYTVNRGALKGGKRTDGKELKVGSAIFTGNDQDGRNHVGIYIGNGKVLEAGGTQKGVILTAVTASKWTWWAEMKYVDYAGTTTPEKPSSSSGISVTYPTVRQGSRGEIVTQLQTFLAKTGSSLQIDGIFGSGTRSAVQAFQRKYGLDVDGIVGPKTWTKLLEVAGNIKIPDATTPKKYTLKIPDLTEAEMNELLKKYPKAEKI